jgi:hypothetical protein
MLLMYHNVTIMLIFKEKQNITLIKKTIAYVHSAKAAWCTKYVMCLTE